MAEEQARDEQGRFSATGEASGAANAATRNAQQTGKPEDHRAAAKSHEKAQEAYMAAGKGDSKMAKFHEKRQDLHEELASRGEDARARGGSGIVGTKAQQPKAPTRGDFMRAWTNRAFKKGKG